MMLNFLTIVLISLGLLTAPTDTRRENTPDDEKIHHSDETQLQNIRQLTSGGRNAEAYFSFDGKSLIFQSTREPFECDQIMRMNLDGSNQVLISTGKGRTTCAYFLPGDKKILYASTHLHGDNCPPPPDRSKGYVWGVFSSYDLIIANADGTNPKPLFASPGYDAEATVSPKGDKIVFTSTRDGDLDLYTMNIDGSNAKRITSDIGYDGGAFYSWDGKKIVYRAHHPTDPEEIKEYKELLSRQLVKPTAMEIFVIDADGKNRKQLTSNGAANFAPFFHPDNQRIIFSSNVERGGRQFDLFIMNIDGSNLKRITRLGDFNSFPMFSKDGKKLVFVSDRNAKGSYEYNIFIAEWVD